MEVRRHAVSRLLSTVLAALVLAAAPAAAHARSALHARAAGSGADASAAAISRQAIRNAVVCLINQDRTTRRLPPLHASPLLDRSAQAWTNVMVASASFTHGSDFSARLTAAGYAWSSTGENIATGFATPRQVVRAWMGSPGHCRNILDPTFADVGTGVNSHRLRQYGPSTWTQDFGLGMGHQRPSGNYVPQRGCPYRV
jgi:uncharacterized protein YkwD